MKTAIFGLRIIQYGNRFRSQDRILSEQLKEAENCFYAYQYEEAYDIAARAVEKASPGAVARLEADAKQPARSEIVWPGLTW